MLPAAGDGHDVVVRGKVNRLPRPAHGQLAEHIQPGEPALGRRQAFLQEFGGNCIALRLETERRKLVGEPGGHRIVVFPRRIHG